MLDSEAPTQPLRTVDSCGPVRSDALIDRDADQLDVVPTPEEAGQKGRRRARILPAAHANRDPLAVLEIDLGPKLAFRASLYEGEKVVATKMFPAVANPFDRGESAPVAGHERSHRRGDLRAHGPDGGDAGGGGRRAWATPTGGPIVGPWKFVGAPKVGCRTRRSYATAARITDHDPARPVVSAIAPSVTHGLWRAAAGSTRATLMMRRSPPTTKTARNRDHQ